MASGLSISIGCVGRAYAHILVACDMTDLYDDGIRAKRASILLLSETQIICLLRVFFDYIDYLSVIWQN